MSISTGGLETQQELVRRIGEQLYACLPANADELRLDINAIFSSYSESCIVAFAKGVEVGSLPEAGDSSRDARRLREVMATPEGGAWFAAVFSVFRDGHMSVSFNYDEEPIGLTIDGKPQSLMPALFARDWEKYPRSPERTPAWLAEKVEEGRRQIAELEARRSS